MTDHIPVATNYNPNLGAVTQERVPSASPLHAAAYGALKVQTPPPAPAPQPAADITGTDVDAILAQRGSRYGKFCDHAEVTQKLKKVIYAHLEKRIKQGNPAAITPSMMEAIDMVCHKLGRIANGDPTYADSWIDIAGYTTLVAKELNGEIV